MNARKNIFRLSVLGLAMVGTVASMYAYADEEEAAALKYPTSSVEVEEIYVSAASQKFGEYNGLNRKGGYTNGNLNIRGGGAYKDNENGDTTRWSVIGTDLGLTNRSASVGYADQGNYSVNVGYDALQHNLAPGYQTPYNGSAGSNYFTLPSGVGFPMGTTAASNPNTRNMTPSQLGAFKTVDISTTRQNTSISGTKIIDPTLSANFEFNHLEQTGGKLQSLATSSVGSTTIPNEVFSILPSPTTYQTDTLTAGLNWQGEKARLSGSYFGSFFRDANNGVQWQTWGTTGTPGTSQIQTMSTAPSNQLQQLNLGGGYDFSSVNKLVGNLSIARNTQTTSTAYDAFQYQAGYTPSPFNGLVNTSHADFKFSNYSVKDLTLSLSAKYDSRDNLSSSNIQRPISITGGQGIEANTPLSYKKAQVDLAGDYRITKDQKLNITYSNQNLSRYCNQYATGPSSTPFTSGYIPAGADCVTANFSRTNGLNANYKLKASETVDVKLGYGVSIRQTTWNQQAIATYGSGTSGSMAPAAYGYNGGDYLGYRPYFEASQNQQTVKGKVNWQAAEDLSFGLGGNWIYSIYPQSTYGMQSSTLASINFDTAYNYAEKGIATAYVTQQFGNRFLSDGSTAASGTSRVTNTWTNNQQENDITFGLGAKHSGLLADKLSLSGDATYSMGQTAYYTAGGGCTTGTATATCGSPGPIINRMASLKFGANYKYDKHSTVGVKYMYQHLYASDYMYNVLVYGGTNYTQMPTNQNAGGYNVNVIAATYTYSFD